MHVVILLTHSAGAETAYVREASDPNYSTTLIANLLPLTTKNV